MNISLMSSLVNFYIWIHPCSHHLVKVGVQNKGCELSVWTEQQWKWGVLGVI